jgi:hypothetical protein
VKPVEVDFWCCACNRQQRDEMLTDDDTEEGEDLFWCCKRHKSAVCMDCWTFWVNHPQAARFCDNNCGVPWPLIYTEDEILHTLRAIGLETT